MSSRKGTKAGGTRSELRATQSRVPEQRAHGWLSSLLGLLLLAPAWISTETFFTCVRHAAMHYRYWAHAEFVCFAIGAALWVITFFTVPRPLVVYVFGHELTHALWVLLSGGKVSAFKVGPDGGHILSDKHNVWIALAPYFFPLYSIAVILLYGAASLEFNMEPYQRFLYMAIGWTWAFHISFTLWMIPKGQSDLTYYGTFFSVMIIYIMNLAVLTVLLIMASPHVTWQGFASEWLRNLRGFAHWAVALGRAARLSLHG